MDKFDIKIFRGGGTYTQEDQIDFLRYTISGEILNSLTQDKEEIKEDYLPIEIHSIEVLEDNKNFTLASVNYTGNLEDIKYLIAYECSFLELIE